MPHLAALPLNWRRAGWPRMRRLCAAPCALPEAARLESVGRRGMSAPKPASDATVLHNCDVGAWGIAARRRRNAPCAARHPARKLRGARPPCSLGGSQPAPRGLTNSEQDRRPAAFPPPPVRPSGAWRAFGCDHAWPAGTPAASGWRQAGAGMQAGGRDAEHGLLPQGGRDAEHGLLPQGGRDAARARPGIMGRGQLPQAALWAEQVCAIQIGQTVYPAAGAARACIGRAHRTGRMRRRLDLDFYSARRVVCAANRTYGTAWQCSAWPSAERRLEACGRLSPHLGRTATQWPGALPAPVPLLCSCRCPGLARQAWGTSKAAACPLLDFHA